MRRFILPGLVAVAAVALLALLAFGVGGQNAGSSIDAQVAKGDYPVAPSLHMALPVLGSGARTSLAAYHGKVVILNVFASWCDPCKAEAPILADAERSLRARDATILGVTYLDNPTASEQFVHQQHISYPVLRDVDGAFVRSFGTTGVPETFVINRQGRIQALRRFQLNRTWLQTTLPPILAGHA
jgi:cytochrome c biogenesis protein CcmG, thiol:disulfide interchange protein DsbE